MPQNNMTKMSGNNQTGTALRKAVGSTACGLDELDWTASEFTLQARSFRRQLERSSLAEVAAEGSTGFQTVARSREDL